LRRREVSGDGGAAGGFSAVGGMVHVEELCQRLACASWRKTPSNMQKPAAIIATTGPPYPATWAHPYGKGACLHEPGGIARMCGATRSFNKSCWVESTGRPATFNADGDAQPEPGRAGSGPVAEISADPLMFGAEEDAFLFVPSTSTLAARCPGFLSGAL